MTTANSTLRVLLLYAVLIPVAVIIGRFSSNLAGGGDVSTAEFGLVFLFILVLCAPLILKWHYAVLLLSWNATAVVFFLPGHPQIWMMMAIASLWIAVVRRALLRNMRFAHAASVVLPLIFLGGIIVLTGAVRGGLGLRIFGSQTVGGKDYFGLFCGIAGFFAMLAYRVPQYKAQLFVGLFFLGSLCNLIGSLLPYVSPQFYYIFAIFPVDTVPSGLASDPNTITRFFGLALAASGLFFYLLAREGIQEPLKTGKLRHFVWLGACVIVTAASGFRSHFIFLGLVFVVMFYFEGLFRSKYGAWFAGAAALGLLLLIPIAPKLPLSIQRSLSFLPYKVDPIAQRDADSSTQWRREIWQQIWEVERPKYFWLGKGVGGVSSVDLQMTDTLLQSRGLVAGGAANASQDVAILTGSYHNGPLTVLIQFGIWGLLAWIWFLAASIRALHLNYRYGDPALKKINALLLSYLVARTIYYFSVFGDFRYDFPFMMGIVGLALALNHGIRKPLAVRSFVKPLTLITYQKSLPLTAKAGSFES